MDVGRLGHGLVASAILIAASFVSGSASAQEGTPEGAAGPNVAPFPAAIYEGTCDVPSEDAAFELPGVSYGIVGPQSLVGGLEDATPVTAAVAAPPGIDPVAIGATTLDLNLTELFVGDRQYAIVVADPASDAALVCGAIGGPLLQMSGQTRTTLDEASIAIALREQDDSGYSGIAWLRSPEGGVTEGTSTTVTIFLIPPEGA